MSEIHCAICKQPIAAATRTHMTNTGANGRKYYFAPVCTPCFPGTQKANTTIDGKPVTKTRHRKTKPTEA